MTQIKIRDKQVNIDIKTELEEFDFRNAKWSEDKLIACSPFRDDSTPSFYITFSGEYAGVWGDSGYDDEYLKNGNFVKLLSLLRDESYEETEQYLLEKYDAEYSEDVVPLIKPYLKSKKSQVILDESLYKKKLDNEYLINRGIHPKIIEMNGIFDAGEAVGIPWKNLSGDVCAIKYRSKKSKVFWYEDNATPLAKLIFGLDIVIKRNIKRIAICEAEIDAMTFQSDGIMAVAIGGARLNEYQADLLIQSGVEEVILAGDNDKQGRKFNDIVKQRLKNTDIKLFSIDYSYFNDKKDVNELSREELKNVIEHLNIDNHKMRNINILQKYM